MSFTTITGESWQFSPIPNIEESNFDKILERFYNLRISGLVRENIQNALDARLLNFEGPVIVTIRTGSIKKSDIPGIDEVIGRISCLQGRNSYTEETIAHMKNKMAQDEVNYISFEDYHTRGLTGAINGQSNSKEDTWAIYAYNKGVHAEEKDEAVETSRGGSHGVGKIASNAASDLHVMFFANCDAEGNQHLGGTVQLIEHVYNDHCYRSTGYFSNVKIEEEKRKFYPFKNTFHKAFEKKTRGLKIIVPFLRDEYNDEDEIIRSVCDSFFISILQRKLEVIVNDKKITHETIHDFVIDTNYYEQTMAEMKKVFTPLYVDTYLRVKPRIITVSNGVTDYKFKLYFRYDEQIPKGRVAVIRTIGMKIEDFKVKNNANKPYNAVLIGGANEDAYLKSLENESHTQLSDDHIKDTLLQKQAKRFINNLSREITKIIDDAIKENNPTDGAIDTKDILYVVENQFKKDLSDVMGTVKMSKGKTIVKMTEDKPKTMKKTKNTNPGGKSGGGQENPKPRPVKPVRTKPSDDQENEVQERSMKYSVHPDIVERLIIGNQEFVKFDFSESKEIHKEKSCDISLSIIDGMGAEYTDEFKLIDNYVRVIDRATGNNCKSQSNVIKNVKITKGVAQLQFELNRNFNKALKFVYYVEV